METNQTVVRLIQENEIGIIEIHYPPVNALSQLVREGIVKGITEFNQSNSIQAIIIRCSERTFIAGADIKEFGKPPTEPFLPDVVNSIEASNKPVIASLFGTTLGGGFEVALACHYRVAVENAKVGLPEVNLGLIPGAGGTQRLPRVVGVEKAIDMITNGNHLSVKSLSDTSLFDKVVSDTQDLNAVTMAFAQSIVRDSNQQLIRTGELKSDCGELDWDAILTRISKKARGKDAPVVAAKVIKETYQLPINEGMTIERKAFLQLRDSEQSSALRYVFGAEKAAAKTIISAAPISVKTVGIVGAGNMGSGIATAFLTAGFNVNLVEQNESALAAGVARIKSNFEAGVKRGKFSETQLADNMKRLTDSVEYQSLEDCELVLEAIFEDIEVKKTLFAKLDEVCQPTCIFATNTSYLDINAIAKVLNKPERMIGMHFFSPANLMKLLEVVKAEASSDEALATAMAVGKQLKKMTVLVGVCFGFAGNRMYTRYGREIQQMLLEGASVEQIDSALTDWGMAMGPLAVQDLSGIDIGHNARSAQPFPEYDPGYFRAAATMVENGRLGRKTGKGFYKYDENGKQSVDPDVAELISSKANELNIKPKSFNQAQIVERALLALISEGVKLLEEGIVQRLSDIDVIWLHGYGFPRHKGGPMFQAKQMGKEKISALLSDYRASSNNSIWPNVDLTALD